MDRSKLEKYCYEMFYLQGVPVAEVARKTGLNRQTIYRYLRNFEAINPQVAEQMKKMVRMSLLMTIRPFKRRWPVYKES